MKFVEYLTKEKIEELGLKGLLGGFTPRYALANITVDEFKLMKNEEFENLRGVGEAKRIALIWLRDYLNGKVGGKYEKQEISDNIEIRRLTDKVKSQNEKEEKLCKKIRELEEINSELRKELNECRKRGNKYQKAKDLILSIE